jgi:hypothetical protein
MTTMIGWLGASLVLLSYAQRDAVRLRQINLVASIAMTAFDLALRIWPSLVLEVLLAAMNVYRLRQQRQATRPRWLARRPVGALAA